jgi:hypothetical protein
MRRPCTVIPFTLWPGGVFSIGRLICVVVLAVLMLVALLTPLHAGQSLQVSTTNASSALPNRVITLPSRIEFYLHDWNAAPTANSPVVISTAIGFQSTLIQNGGGASISFNNTLEVISGGCGPLPIFGLAQANGSIGVYARYQHNPSNTTDTVELWDINGVRVQNCSWTYTTTGSPSPGFQVGGSFGENRSIAFARVYSDLVAINSKPPTTADGGATRLIELKFDGNLNDSASVGPYNATMSSGSPTYVNPTPNQNVIPVIRTSNATTWSNWVSMRAGYPAQLDGSSSFSQADGSSTVTYLWQILSGPSIPLWNSHTTSNPTLTGIVFGSYNTQLTVTDTNGAKATTALQIGAVATDTNGVVVNSDPNVDLIYGPMIAFGKNPWQYQDERAIYATTARSAFYTTNGVDVPTWSQALPGTISYPFTPLSTTLCGSVASATTLSLTVCTVEKLDLTTFPTHLSISGYGGEDVVVTGTTGTSGTQTLTIGYDGRGFSAGEFLHKAAQAWSNGTSVTQQKVTGSGTSFLATFTPAGAGVPGAIAYNTGTVGLTAGSSTLTGTGTNWTLLNLCNQNIALCGLTVRVSGTHSSTPFAFFAFVNSLTDTTHIVLSRPFPSDADTASGLTYAIIKAPTDGSGRNMVVHYTPSTSVAYPYDGSTYMFTTACETDTSCYGFSFFDPASINPILGSCLGFTGMSCAKHIAYMDGLGYVGDNGGINFYDEALAHYALYKRSGWQPALDAFHKVEGVEGDATRTGWMFYPEMAAGDLNPPARRASVTGAVVAAVLDGKASNWPGIRKFAATGVANISSPLGCNNDLREGSAYPFSWLTFAALFDPNDTGQLAYWGTQLGNAYTFDAGCAGTGTPVQTNSWAGGFLWNNNKTPALTGTNGSASMTSSSLIDPRICSRIASGTDAVVTNGSDVVTSPGSHFVSTPGKIMFFGDATYPFLTFDFIYDNTGQVHLSGQYPGSSRSSVSWAMEYNSTYPGLSADAGMTIGTGNNDSQLQYNWSCSLTPGTVNTTIATSIATGPHTVTPANITNITNGMTLYIYNADYTNSEQVTVSNVSGGNFDATFGTSKTGPGIHVGNATGITLDRPWNGSNSSALYAWHAATDGLDLAGKGTQPFVLGIKTLQMGYSAKMAGALGTNYNTLAVNAATWIKNYGVDPVSGGMYYGRVFQMCEPIFADSSQPQNFASAWRNPGCSFNGSNAGNQSKAIARALIGEAQNAARVSFQADNSGANKTFWDTVYNNQWGATGLTDMAFYTDGITTSNIDNTALSAGKWTGFFFGIGMSHQWPAVRLGGVAPAVNRSVYVGYKLSSVTNAASFQIILTTPSGKTTTVTCSSSPCLVTSDARQGAHLMTLQYLNATPAVILQTVQPLVITVQ